MKNSPSRKWTGSHIGGRKTHSPLDRFEHHLLKMRLVPGRVGMTPTDVEDTSLAIRLCPDDGEVPVRSPLSILFRQARRIEAHDHVHFVAGKGFFEYGMLVVKHERQRAPRVGARKFWVFDDDPRVRVELDVHVAT